MTGPTRRRGQSSGAVGSINGTGRGAYEAGHEEPNDRDKDVVEAMDKAAFVFVLSCALFSDFVRRQNAFAS